MTKNPVLVARHSVDGVFLFVKLLATQMPRAEYEALPDRNDVGTLPVDGVTYRDRHNPGLTFLCHAGPNWARYSYDTFAPRLL